MNQSGAAGALAAIYSDPVSIEVKSLSRIRNNRRIHYVNAKCSQFCMMDIHQAMFSLLDNDGSGEISFQEVETVVDRLNAENVKGSQPHLNAQSIWEVLDQVSGIT